MFRFRAKTFASMDRFLKLRSYSSHRPLCKLQLTLDRAQQTLNFAQENQPAKLEFKLHKK
jgi:hypothetical protein